MLPFLMALFLLFSAPAAFSQDCPTLRVPHYPDSDGDNYVNGTAIRNLCLGQESTREYVAIESAHKDEDGSIIMDCAPHNSSRGRLVDVWPDPDGDGYATVDSSIATECFGGVNGIKNDDGITYPEDEGKTSDEYIRSRTFFDCDETVFGETQKLFFSDNDGDGQGSGEPLGKTCSKTAVTTNYDCDDQDPLIFESWIYATPDRKVCDPNVFRLTIDKSDFKLKLNKTDLDSAQEAGTVYGKSFSIIPFVNNQPSSRFQYWGCKENCPSNWSVDKKGAVIWSKIALENLTPIKPHESRDGKFDPEKSSAYKIKLTVGTGFGTGYTKTEYLTVEYEPKCPELKTKKGIMAIFDKGFVRENQAPVPDMMALSFSPKCPSSGSRVKLADLAEEMEIDHFNWWQSFKDSPTYYEVSDSTFQQVSLDILNNEDYRDYPRSLFKQTSNDWKIDPPLNSQKYVVVAKNPDAELFYAMTIGVEDTDEYPYYWNEDERKPGFGYKKMQNEYRSAFEDSPRRPEGWYDLGIPPVRFLTRVAGVGLDGQFIVWSHLTHSWSSNAESISCHNITEPKAKLECEAQGNWYKLPFGFGANANWDKYVPGLTRGGIVSHEVVSENKFFVPKLKASHLNNLQELLDSDGDGFSYEIVERKVDSGLEEGIVISQNPVAFSAVAQPGAIRIVVSGGSPKNCGDILHGQTSHRTRYSSSSVPYGKSCDSVKETQSATCNDGQLIFSGTAASDSCVVAPKPSNPLECKKTIKKICKVGLLNSIECDLPDNIISIKKDGGYKGTSCHVAPKKITIWNFLSIINSYSIEKESVRVNFGCNSKFEVTFKDKCSN